MSATLPLNTLVDLVRFKLYEAIVVDNKIYADVDYLDTKFENRFTKAFIISAVRQLETSKHIVVDHSASKPALGLSPLGIRAVEKSLRDAESVAARYRDEGLAAFEDDMIAVGRVPASDRIVQLNHNSESFAHAQALLADAKKALKEDNEVGLALGDERSVALAEIEHLEAMVEQPQVRANALRNYATRSLTWIGEKGAGTIIVELAKRLLDTILGWLI